MKRLPAFNENPTCEVIDEILWDFQIYKEIQPWRGEVDTDLKRITVNPAFDMYESLAHEMLHYYYDIYLGTGAMHWLVTVKAKELVKKQDVIAVLEKHLLRAQNIPSRNLFGMIG